MYSDSKLKTTLDWCANNEVTFRMVIKDGVLNVWATHKNLSSFWPVNELSLGGFGTAMYSAIECVRSGLEFHQKHGGIPDRDACKGEGRTPSS